MHLKPHLRTQTYYNKLAQIWNNGAIYYNPKTKNSTYINLNKDVTAIFKGNLPQQAIQDGKFNIKEFGDAVEIKRIITQTNPKTNKTIFTIAERKPNGTVYQYLSKYNCDIRKIEI